MKILNLTPGTPEWDAHRAKSRNASEASVIMGCSKKTGRQEFLRMKATGSEKEFSDWVRNVLFAEGHRIELAIRPHIEGQLGFELFPIVAATDDGYLSASFDGHASFDDEKSWECKQWNEAKADDVNAGRIPMEDFWQVVQQSVVNDGRPVMYTVSDGTPEKTVSVWYELTEDHKRDLLAGWRQFDEDHANYQHVEEKAPLVAAPIVDLPAVSVQVKGEIAIINNFDVFEVALRDFIDNRLIRTPQTDQDFADLDTQIKSLKKAEDALVAAEAEMIKQVSSIDTMKRAKDMLYKMARDNRLMAEKLLEAEKTNRRVAIQEGGKKAFAEHVAALNTRLGKPYMPAIPADFVGVTKGKRTITSIQDAVDTELARAKIAANACADSIDMNLKSLRELAAKHPFLFADTAQLVLKSNDDLVNVIKLRIAEHDAAEKARIDAEVARKLAEEKAAEEKKLRDEADARAKEEQREREAEAAAQARAQRDLEQHNAKPANTAPTLANVEGGMALTREEAIEYKNPIKQEQSQPVVEDTMDIKRPSDDEIIAWVATCGNVSRATALQWIIEIKSSNLEVA